ncbi:MAG: hypothetical protein IJR89_05530 [Clostridia bacterium]|nr:hypothetical protein [Clostridia bacterium]
MKTRLFLLFVLLPALLLPLFAACAPETPAGPEETAAPTETAGESASLPAATEPPETAAAPGTDPAETAAPETEPAETAAPQTEPPATEPPATSAETSEKEDPPVEKSVLFTVSDVTAWVGYPAFDFYPVFADGKEKEPLSFEYDRSALQIDAAENTVKALKEGTYEVRAYSEHSAPISFTVYAKTVDKTAKDGKGNSKWSASSYSSRASSRANAWKQNGNDGVTTVFIGDSFFDDSFWTNFYASDYYGGFDALRLGISATTTYDWETWAKGWLAAAKPRNIVMHLGTNNVYDDGDDGETAADGLKRLFTLIHNSLPDAKIYWFSISQRSYDAARQQTVRQVNAEMKNWCAQRDYITYIHTADTLTASMLKDGTHPKPECYTVFRDALAGTDIEIAKKEISAEIKEIQNTQSQTIAAGTGVSFVTYKGGALDRNFILRGKLDITESGTNAHVEFGVNSAKERVLLWDNTTQKTFKLCIPYVTTGIPAEDIYRLESGKTLTLDWKIVMTDDDLYFFIGDELKLVYTGLPAGALVIGSENAACRFYDMTALTKTDDGAEYEQALAEYADLLAEYGKSPAGKIRV